MTTRVEIEGVEFEWSNAKEAANIREHGVDFRTAALAFFDPKGVIFPELTTAHEERFVLLGKSSGITLLFVVYIEGGNGGQTIRLISARQANKSNWRRYLGAW